MMVLERLDVRGKLFCLVVFYVAAFHAATPIALGLTAAVTLVLCLVVRLQARDVLRMLGPLVAILVITFVMQVLYLQSGTVVAQVGPVAVTAEALWQGTRVFVCLLCVLAMSAVFMRCTNTRDLVRAFRWMLRPLERRGLNCQGFALALDVAFSFIPVLMGSFRQLKAAQESRLASFDGGIRQRVKAYTRLFAPLVRSSMRHADALAQAVVSRGFGAGAVQTSLVTFRLGGRDIAFIVATLALCALVFFV